MYLMDSIDVRGISLPTKMNTGEKNPDGGDVGNNVTGDIAIRKALNYGIDRTSLCEGALNGIGYPNYDGIAHQLPWANNATAIEDGDIAKANETLEKPDGLTVMVTESVRKTEPKHPLNYITHLMLLKDKQLQFLFLNKPKKWVLK